jgi:hypothetical protein
VKFALRERKGLSLESLAAEQRALFAPLLNAIEPSDVSDFVATWRREHLEAIDRFLTSLAESNR